MDNILMADGPSEAPAEAITAKYNHRVKVNNDSSLGDGHEKIDKEN
jgi:hypothetical protein